MKNCELALNRWYMRFTAVPFNCVLYCFLAWVSPWKRYFQDDRDGLLLPIQQIRNWRPSDHCKAIPRVLIDWTVLQIDQTESAHHVTTLNSPECCLHADIVSRLWLFLFIIVKKRYGLVPSLNSISNSNEQVFFNRADTQSLYNQPTVSEVISEMYLVRQLTLC